MDCLLMTSIRECGSGDAVKEINDCWGNADIDEIYNRVADWKKENNR